MEFSLFQDEVRLSTAAFRPCGAGVLSFASPKESSQRKGDPSLRGRLTPTSLCYSLPAGAAELGLRPQTVLALFPPAAALLGAVDGDPKNVAGTGTVRQHECPRRLLKNSNSRHYRSNPDAFPVPLRGADQRRRAGGSWLALFEPQASSGKPPGLPSSARNPAGAPTQGSPFLWLLSFGEAKESTPALKAESNA